MKLSITLLFVAAFGLALAGLDLQEEAPEAAPGTIQYHDYSEEIAEYLSDDWPSSFDWMKDVFVGKMEELPKNGGPDVDDHQSTPIGQGLTIAFVESTLQITNNDFLPKELRQGLVGKKTTYKGVTRMSHTNAAGMDLLRIAFALDLGNGKRQNLHFTETAKNFPMGEINGLKVFAAGAKGAVYGAIEAAKHPIAAAQLASTVMQMKRDFGPEVQTQGAAGKSWFSMTPYELAQKAVVKFSLTPVTAMTPPSDYTVDNLRDQIRNHLGTKSVKYNLNIQVASDPSTNPINDVGTVWNEDDAPWHKIGELTLHRSQFDKKKDGLSTDLAARLANSKTVVFGPGESMHAPVGDIAQFRKYLYPVYDSARQNWLLGRKKPQCPFAQAMEMGAEVELPADHPAVEV